MALIETLTDNFNDGSRNGALWSEYSSDTTVAETGGRLEITLPAGETTLNYAGYYSVSNYDLTNSSAYVEVTKVTAATSTGMYFNVSEQGSFAGRLAFYKEGTVLYFERWLGEVSSVTSVTYNSTNHRWWRIRNSGANVLWETSPNGATWTTQRTLATPFTITTMQVEVGAGTFGSESVSRTVQFDNLNFDPTLTDNIVTATTNNANPYASGKLRRNNGSGWTDVTTTDLYFKTYSSTGATTITHNSTDPSDMLRAVITNYNNNGGTIQYDGISIDDTNTTVSYTFVTQTILESIDKILELSPQGWYWYVDSATNLIHFHEKSTSADHSLTLGKDIERLNVAKRTDGIINTIYFRGGDTGGGVYLYKKYQDSNSVGSYGIRAMKYVDERVTVTNTANTISNTILSTNSSPEVRLDGIISDSNGNGYGYDIESINIGDVINVQNVPGDTGRSLWDVAMFDEDRFDYNISQLGSMYLQIVRKEYSPTSLSIFCSTIPPDVSKRIEDINRNLEASQTADNPSAPS